MPAPETEWTPLRHAGEGFYHNDLYQVHVQRPEDGLAHLTIRRPDGAPILRDWQHFQNIKNELFGPEARAFEIYPPESNKVDVENVYHLFSYDPTTGRG